MENIRNLSSKVKKYKKVLENTINYRKEWDKGLKKMILEVLEKYAKAVELDVKIDVQAKIKNMEAISFSLGKENSGIHEIVNEDTERPIIKFYGMLVYQQMFNGKINVMMFYPTLEGVGEPQPPKQLEILRPHELTELFIIRHFEEFIKELTAWEDLDDDDDTVSHTHIGFNHTDFHQEDE